MVRAGILDGMRTLPMGIHVGARSECLLTKFARVQIRTTRMNGHVFLKDNEIRLDWVGFDRLYLYL